MTITLKQHVDRVSRTAIVLAAALAVAWASEAQEAPPAPAAEALSDADYVLFEIELLQIDHELASNNAITFSGEMLEFHAGAAEKSPTIVIGERAEIEMG